MKADVQFSTGVNLWLITILCPKHNTVSKSKDKQVGIENIIT